MTRTPLATRVLGPFQRFFSTEAAGGVVLLVCAAIALAWSNSPWAPGYHHLWETPLGFDSRAFGLTLTLHEWVNDGLMAIFFLLVGLEIKRELLVGELSSRRSAALPVAAAFGGMVVPAAIYAAVNRGGAGASGWGIPMATDIAFALGILALLGERMPSGLRVLLAALAIVDDLGAVIVIALFYTSAVHWGAVAGAAAILAMLVAANRLGIRAWATYVALGLLLWVFMLLSGVHSTIAGVLLALTIPARTRGTGDSQRTLLDRFESALHAPVAFLIVPVFALANAGVPLGGGVAAELRSPVAIGVMLGLLLGKPAGIMLASVAAVRAGVAQLPPGVSWRQVHGVSWLGGIGFTMSLFIAGLAFANATTLDVAKLAVLTASACAGVIGYLLLRGSVASDAHTT
jgi:NhaA family Na+:H+ antiporter